MADRFGITTDFLMATPSYFSGVARLVDLFGVFDDYNISSTPGEADAKAILADWMVTGNDFNLNSGPDLYTTYQR